MNEVEVEVARMRREQNGSRWARVITVMILLGIALVAAGCGGGVSQPVNPIDPGDQGGAEAPRSAPSNFQVTAVTLTGAARAWLQANPGGAAAVPAGAVPAYVRPAQSQGPQMYAGLRWQWDPQAGGPVDSFVVQRNGTWIAEIPYSLGGHEASSPLLTFAWSDGSGSLAAGSKVTYRVAAKRGTARGPFSGAITVEPLPFLTDPALTGPADGAEVTRLPVLTWSEVPEAHGYVVEVFPEGSSSSSPIWSGFTTGTRLDLDRAAGAAVVQPGSYRWYVLALSTLPLYEPGRSQYDSVSLAISPVRRFRFVE